MPMKSFRTPQVAACGWLARPSLWNGAQKPLGGAEIIHFTTSGGRYAVRTSVSPVTSGSELCEQPVEASGGAAQAIDAAKVEIAAEVFIGVEEVGADHNGAA